MEGDFVPGKLFNNRIGVTETLQFPVVFCREGAYESFAFQVNKVQKFVKKPQIDLCLLVKFLGGTSPAQGLIDGKETFVVLLPDFLKKILYRSSLA